MLSLLPKSVSRHAWTSKSLLLLRSARDTRPAWHVCTYGGNQGPGHQQQPASHVSTGNGIYQQAPSVPSPPTPQAAAQGPVASGAQVPTAAPPSEHVPLEEVRNDTYVQNKVTLIGVVASPPQRNGRCVSFPLHVANKTTAGHLAVIVEVWDDQEGKHYKGRQAERYASTGLKLAVTGRLRNLPLPPVEAQLPTYGASPTAHPPLPGMVVSATLVQAVNEDPAHASTLPRPGYSRRASGAGTGKAPVSPEQRAEREKLEQQRSKQAYAAYLEGQSLAQVAEIYPKHKEKLDIKAALDGLLLPVARERQPMSWARLAHDVGFTRGMGLLAPMDLIDLFANHLSYTYGPDWAQTAPRTKDGWLKLKPLREMLVGGPDGLTAGHPCRESDELRPVAMELQQAVMAQEAAAGGDQDVTFRQIRFAAVAAEVDAQEMAAARAAGVPDADISTSVTQALIDF